MAHTRQSIPGSGRDVKTKLLKSFQVVPSSFGSGPSCLQTKDFVLGTEWDAMPSQSHAGYGQFDFTQPHQSDFTQLRPLYTATST